MLGPQRIQAITDHILARSPADQTEVTVIASDSALTRFANSAIHQNVAETDVEVRIRVVLAGDDGKRVGVTSTHHLEESALTGALERAVEIARVQPRNPHFRSLPAPQPVKTVAAFEQATADCTPEARAAGAGLICRLAGDAGVAGSGSFTTAAVEFTVANSLGTRVYHVTSFAEIDTVILSDTSAGHASALARDVRDLDLEAVGREALAKCLDSQNPRPLEPGDYTVVLDPYATQDVVQMLAHTGLGAVALQEGRSFMVGRLGEQIVDPRISLWDDGLDPAGIPMPFDFEGVPKQRVDFIEQGVARGVVYDSYRAGREPGKQSTGHALPAPNPFGPMPINTFLAPGDSTVEQMIAGTRRGLYITRFHYTRPVEPMRVVITGMTRDGTFLIENGEIAYPVQNLRFTQSYLEALNRVEAIGRETKLLASWALARQSVPALKVGGFRFTGATTF